MPLHLRVAQLLRHQQRPRLRLPQLILRLRPETPLELRFRLGALRLKHAAGQLQIDRLNGTLQRRHLAPLSLRQNSAARQRSKVQRAFVGARRDPECVEEQQVMHDLWEWRDERGGGALASRAAVVVSSSRRATASASRSAGASDACALRGSAAAQPSGAAA